MQSATILQPLFASWPGFTALLVLPVIVRILAPGLFKRHLGEMRVLSALRGLDPATYRHFHNLELPHPAGSGTLCIPHVVVSPFGIFAISACRHRGRLDGSSPCPKWLPRLHQRHHRNPLDQNQLHVDALMNFLRIPEPPFHPVIVFMGGSGFKFPLSGVVQADSLIPWLRRHTVTMLDSSMLSRAVSRLEQQQDSLKREAVDDKLQLHTLHVRHAA